MRIITRPIEHWPGQLHHDLERERSPFSATWTQTRKLLTKEAEALGATEIVLQLALTEADIRLDGWPYARAKTAHPGVIVSIEGDRGPMSFPCDAFTRRYTDDEDWHANVRAVALGLEALRKVERYGITPNHEQYTGFRAIEAGGTSPTSEQAALETLRRHAGWDTGPDHDDREDIARAYRAAAKNTHPDHGGDPDDFRAVQLALEVLSR